MNQRDYKAGTGSALIKTGRPREIDGQRGCQDADSNINCNFWHVTTISQGMVAKQKPFSTAKQTNKLDFNQENDHFWKLSISLSPC